MNFWTESETTNVQIDQTSNPSSEISKADIPITILSVVTSKIKIITINMVVAHHLKINQVIACVKLDSKIPKIETVSMMVDHLHMVNIMVVVVVEVELVVQEVELITSMNSEDIPNLGMFHIWSNLKFMIPVPKKPK